MNDIVCPHCKKGFKLDKKDYADIFKQVYDKEFDVRNKSILIVGDVSHSGKTMQLVISDLIQYNPLKIKTSVIINRDHALFPVKIDYSGLSLSTSVNEHVDVIIDEKKRFRVYLS